MKQLLLFEGGFPETIETLLFMQESYNPILSALVNLAGDKVILQGVTPPSSGNYQAGFITYNGNIYPFVPSTANATVSIYKTVEVTEYETDPDNDGNYDKPTYERYYASTADPLPPDAQVITTFPFSDLVPVQLNGRNNMPIGLIALWNDSLGNIPAGWVRMDGNNGTEDFRNCFLKIAGSEINVNVVAGNRFTTLIVANLPPHVHNVPPHVHGGGFVPGRNDWRSGNSTPGQHLGTTPVNNTGASANFDTGAGAGTSTPFSNEPVHKGIYLIQYKGR